MLARSIHRESSNASASSTLPMAKLVFTPVFASGEREIVLPFTAVGAFVVDPDTPGMFGCAGGTGIVL